ncbi:FAD-dependent oxidoreductase [Actinomycetospora sp. CA-101289]|uniref:FAD-dependent oxidoreductase n=1 Tax=Actinomycetospora sp. CA-101289 TaxID=3239893 RepID=UPI003D957A9D
MRVTVVGAGVVGLATAYSLRAAGADVRCLDTGPPMGARSVGDTRIFRVAHGDPALVAEARRASELWDDWSMRARRTLVGAERLVVTGPRVPAWAEAMSAAGAVHRVDRHGALHDPAGGVLDLVATGAFLIAAVSPERATVTAVDADGTVHLADGDPLAADAVVVTAGAGTPALVAPLGVTVPDVLEHHVRFTFDGPADRPCHLDGRADGPLASTYQHRTRSGHWAIGATSPTPTPRSTWASRRSPAGPARPSSTTSAGTSRTSTRRRSRRSDARRPGASTTVSSGPAPGSCRSSGARTWPSSHPASVRS